MYVTPLDNAIVRTRYDMYVHFGKCINIYVHVYTILKKYKRVCTLYVHGYVMVCTMKDTNMYVHRSDVYVHCSDVYVHVYTRFESYKHVHTMYKPVYASFV